MLATCHAWTISRHSIQSHWGHTQRIKPREVEADHRSFISPRPKCKLWDSPTSSLTYIRVDEVANKAAQMGKGGARVNISEAYRMVPVHSDDKRLLGINWNGQVAILTLHSHLVYAVIFTALADGLQWVLQQWGVSYVTNCLDDFITLGPSNSDQCFKNLHIIIKTCKGSGIPLAPHKSVGLTTCWYRNRYCHKGAQASSS